MKNPNRAFKDAIYEQFARIGKAVSSPKRLELLDLLSQGRFAEAAWDGFLKARSGGRMVLGLAAFYFVFPGRRDKIPFVRAAVAAIKSDAGDWYLVLPE